MCNCSRYCLDQLNLNYTHYFKLDDWNCPLDYQILVLRCKQVCHPYNLSGFAGNYFSSIYCGCEVLNKKLICNHGKRLSYALNNKTMKACLKKRLT